MVKRANAAGTEWKDQEKEMEKQQEQAKVKQEEAEKPKKRRSRGKTKQLEEKVAALEAEKAVLTEKYLRLAAEFDNFRKLAAREIENRIRNANEELIVSLLPVLDNLERTLANIPKKKEFAPIREGIELTYKEFKKVLSSFGLEEIESLGKEFDLDLHEAVMMVEDEKHPSNTVVQEHQKGYKLNGKVIRHAKVVVNR